MEQKGTYITLDRIVTIRSNNLDKSIKTKKILEESLIKKVLSLLIIFMKKLN